MHDPEHSDVVVVAPPDPVTVEIFDPPMCCSTGLCGVTIDPVLLDVHGAIARLTAEYAGHVLVERYILGQQAGNFVRQPGVIQRLKEHGLPILPITVVDGTVVKERTYPSYAELKGWIEERSARGSP